MKKMMKKIISILLTFTIICTLLIPVGITKTELIQTATPILEFGRIEGGLMGFAIEFNNTGNTNLSNLTWRTTMTGGFILFSKEANGTIDNITYNSTKIATVVPVIGIGVTEIEIRADADEVPPIITTKRARVLFIFVIIDE
jgi:hypothetical protein